MHTCSQCGQLFEPRRRSDARYCGAACRTGASRAAAKRRQRHADLVLRLLAQRHGTLAASLDAEARALVAA